MVVFKNPDALKHSYIPRMLPYREREYQEIYSELSFLSKGVPPTNMVIVGNVGSGKTITVRKAIADLGINHVYVRCSGSAYKTLVDMSRLFTRRNMWGLSTEMIWDYIDSTMPKPVAVVLDEADKFMVRDPKSDDLLYLLSRRDSTLVILISNRFDVSGYIRDPRVRSSLRPRAMVFRKYSTEEIEGILRYRSREAFEDPESVEGVLPFISALASRQGGDARYAIDLLSASVKVAQMRGDRVLSEDHVVLAREMLESNQIESYLSALGTPHKLVLLAILRLKYARVSTLYSYIEKLSESLYVPSYSTRTIRDAMHELEMMGFIHVKRIKGAYYIEARDWILSRSEKVIDLISSQLGDV